MGKEKINEKKKNIYQKLNAVMGDIAYIQKCDKKVNGLYSFVQADAVMKKFHTAFTKHRIMMVPNIIEHEKSGNLTTLKVEIAFINIDDPSDKIVTCSVGQGVDNQDKGIGKAYTYAIKYALLKTFCLETGDEDDVEAHDTLAHDVSAEETKRISDDQYAELEYWLGDNVERRQALLVWLEAHHGVDKLSHMSEDVFKYVIAQLQKSTTKVEVA